MNAEGCHVGDGYYTTCGGIKVNEKTQILDEEGQVIPDLYAGGSDAGGLYGDSYDVKFAPGSQAGGTSAVPHYCWMASSLSPTAWVSVAAPISTDSFEGRNR